MKGGASFVLRCLLVASLAATLAKAQAGDFCACEEGKDPPACPDNLLKTFGVSSEERSIQEEGDQALWALECADDDYFRADGVSAADACSKACRSEIEKVYGRGAGCACASEDARDQLKKQSLTLLAMHPDTVLNACFGPSTKCTFSLDG
mmetsp:Transcript_6142/g.15151  ORF Transcript_6142/g.15151 Transcript_6142/m.15151 type:complete len:150 (+) Transcript_6142:259-708(+)